MNKDNFVNIGKFLKDKRTKAGLKQVEVAEALKCKSQFVCNWERGASTPPWRLTKNLIKLYKINENEFLNFMMKEYEQMIKSELGLKKKK